MVSTPQVWCRQCESCHADIKNGLYYYYFFFSLFAVRFSVLSPLSLFQDDMFYREHVIPTLHGIFFPCSSDNSSHVILIIRDNCIAKQGYLIPRGHGFLDTYIFGITWFTMTMWSWLLAWHGPCMSDPTWFRIHVILNSQKNKTYIIFLPHMVDNYHVI